MTTQPQEIPLPHAPIYGLIVDPPDPELPMMDHELVGRILVHDLQQQGYKVANSKEPLKQGHLLVTNWEAADQRLARCSAKMLVHLFVRALISQKSGPWACAARYRKQNEMAAYANTVAQLGLTQGEMSTRELLVGVRVMALAAYAPIETMWIVPHVQVDGVPIGWPEVVYSWDRTWLRHQANLRGVAYESIELRKVPAHRRAARDKDMPEFGVLGAVLFDGPLNKILTQGNPRAIHWWLHEIACRYLGDPVVVSDQLPDDHAIQKLKDLMPTQANEISMWERRTIDFMLDENRGAARVDQWCTKNAGRRVVVMGNRLGRKLGLGSMGSGTWGTPPLSSALSSAGQVLWLYHQQAPRTRRISVVVPELAEVGS